MQKLLLFLCLLCYFEANLMAQDAPVVRTHTDGAKIIVYPDGSAVYFNDKSPVPDYQQGDYPIVAVRIEPLASAVDVTEMDLKQIADRKLQIAREAAKLATERAAAARENRQRLEQRLQNAKSGVGTQNASSLQRQVLLARRIETESLEESRKANLQAQQAENVIRQNRYVEAYNESRRKRRESSIRGAERRESLPQARRLFNAYNANFTGYGTPVTEGKQLPSSPCVLAYEGEDPQSGQYVRASEFELFFTHTDESLRPYLEGKEYLTAEAFVHSRAGYRYLTLKLTFANPNAIQTYGYLPKGSILSMHLLDGNFLNLRSAQDANGSWDDAKKELSYTVTYPIDRSMISTLRQSELNYVQLFWSSGFEEYDIYQVDVLQRLFDCL